MTCCVPIGQWQGKHKEAMDTKPLISIVVPVYKVEAYLPACLDSLVGQTYENLEIILVDDGSPDRSGAICDEYAARDPRIRVIHKENGGASTARNAGLAIATGELIAFVDSDDFVSLDMYERMYTHMEADPRLDVVYCAITWYPMKEKLLHMDYYPTGTVVPGREILRRILLDEMGSHPVQGLFKRFCWEGVTFPEGRFFEDLAATYRAFRNVRYVGFLTEPFYHYRSNEESVTHTVNPKKSYFIFLAFRDHFLGAQEIYPEIADQCCTKTAHFAASLYFHYCTGEAGQLESAAQEARDFLKTYKQTVKKNWDILPRSRKLALQVYYASPTLFRLGAKILHITGLQKKMGFQLK